MFGKNKLILIFVCVLFFINISSVCSADNANISVADNHTDVPAGNYADFNDLEKDIGNLNPGDVYNMDKNYIYEYHGVENGPKTIFGQKGIEISADNVTINGNGHIIDGNYKSAIFQVTGNNVKICNLTFINAKYSGWDIPLKSKDENTAGLSHLVVKVTDDMSAVCWMGDNGLIDDCIFSYNNALNGGAIKWSGNNGVINNSLFINNVARGVGGAIYVAGSNVTLANAYILNSTSQLSAESIYLDPKSKNFTLSNCTVRNAWFLIDGNYTGIDVDNYLKYTYYSYVADKYINLIPLMYQAIMFGFINIDDEISTCAQYINDTGDFTFSVMRNLCEYGFVYQKNFIFKNTTLNDAFEHLIDENYHNNVVMARNLNVTNKDTYDFVLRSNADTFIGKVQQFMDMVDPDIKDMRKDKDKFSYDKDVSMALNVILAPGIVIKSNAQWRQHNSFDIVNILGNGAKIQASSDDRDENKWIVTEKDQVYTVYDLKVEGFNNAVYNREAYCVFNNVIFNDNHMKYIIDRDDGAAIVNGGVVVCNNCTFTNNYAKNGGAIFNQGLLSLNNCTFKGNNGYGIGDNVLNIDKGIVLGNGENIKGSKGPITYAESVSSFVSTFATVVGVVCAALAGVGSTVIITILTANPAIGTGIGVLVGTTVGGIFGVYVACTIAPKQYNLCFDRIETARNIIISSVLTGFFSAILAGTIMGAVYSCSAAAKFNPIENPLEDSVSASSRVSSSETPSIREIPPQKVQQISDMLDKDLNVKNAFESLQNTVKEGHVGMEDFDVAMENFEKAVHQSDFDYDLTFSKDVKSLLTNTVPEISAERAAEVNKIIEENGLKNAFESLERTAMKDDFKFSEFKDAMIDFDRAITDAEYLMETEIDSGLSQDVRLVLINSLCSKTPYAQMTLQQQMTVYSIQHYMVI